MKRVEHSMTQISLVITVAFVFSLAVTLAYPGDPKALGVLAMAPGFRSCGVFVAGLL